jgi:ADP-ribosyl-[dinitrogen reductase] hydrolase
VTIPPAAGVRDRAVGALVGLAVGDALGTALEFSERDTDDPLTGMVGGGPFNLRPGEWTDDTAMALCLADSLIASRRLDQRDLIARFVRWWRTGENSCTGSCFDIGGTTHRALAVFERTGNPVAGSTSPRSAGNGSLMRLAPVASYWHDDRGTAEAAARGQSATTHGASAAVEACAYFVHLLIDAIEGRPKDEVLRARAWPPDRDVDRIARGSWRSKSRTEISSSGYVIDTLEAAIWCVAQSSSFRDAALLAANLADDADTVAAVTGQLAGALWGVSGLPPEWTKALAWAEHIVALGEKLAVGPSVPRA